MVLSRLNPDNGTQMDSLNQQEKESRWRTNRIFFEFISNFRK